MHLSQVILDCRACVPGVRISNRPSAGFPLARLRTRTIPRSDVSDKSCRGPVGPTHGRSCRRKRLPERTRSCRSQVPGLVSLTEPAGLAPSKQLTTDSESGSGFHSHAISADVNNPEAAGFWPLWLSNRKE